MYNKNELRQECPLENVLDKMSSAFGPSIKCPSDFGPRKDVPRTNRPLQKCPLHKNVLTCGLILFLLISKVDRAAIQTLIDI